MRSFCSAKAPHIFSAKNISTLDFRRTRRLNESLINDFVKLTMLWTTGPRLLQKKIVTSKQTNIQQNPNISPYIIPIVITKILKSLKRLPLLHRSTKKITWVLCKTKPLGAQQLCACFCVLQLRDYRLGEYNSAILAVHLNEPSPLAWALPLCMYLHSTEIHEDKSKNSTTSMHPWCFPCLIICKRMAHSV